jgi:ribosome-binding protein aMBF1 (putative translation factor)
MQPEKLRAVIRERCEERGWALVDLARAAHIAPNALRRFMAGETVFRPVVVQQIARVLRIRLER